MTSRWEVIQNPPALHIWQNGYAPAFQAGRRRFDSGYVLEVILTPIAQPGQSSGLLIRGSMGSNPSGGTASMIL